MYEFLNFILTNNITLYFLCGVIFSISIDLILFIKNTELYKKINDWVRLFYILLWPVWLIVVVKELFNNK